MSISDDLRCYELGRADKAEAERDALAAKLKEAVEAIQPIMRILALNEQLNVPDDTPLRDIVPGKWPTVGDIRKLITALAQPAPEGQP